MTIELDCGLAVENETESGNLVYMLDLCIRTIEWQQARNRSEPSETAQKLLNLFESIQDELEGVDFYDY